MEKKISKAALKRVATNDKAKERKEYTRNVEYIVKTPEGKVDSSFYSIRAAARWYIACEKTTRAGFKLWRVTLNPQEVRGISLKEAEYIISTIGGRI